MKSILAVTVWLAMASAAMAAEVGGVKLDDRTSLGGAELVLNGAGIRTRAIFKVYVGSLYVAQKSADPKAILEARSPRRVQLNMLRNVSGEDMIGALNSGLNDNNSEAELGAIRKEIGEFAAIMKGVGELKEGGVVQFDFIADQGTRVLYNGQAKGTVAGEAFNRALLRAWLGDKPVQGDLKKALLGG